jgi:hypothetical protein
LWWPANKLAGRYLGPYLRSQVGEAADVAPHDADGIPLETQLDPAVPEMRSVLVDICDTSPS